MIQHIVFHLLLAAASICLYFLQVFNEINSRDMEKINIFKGMFDSWIFLLIIFATIAFQVIIVEFLGAFASTVPLNWQFWLLSVLIGAISMPIAVILKCIPVETKNTSKQNHDGYEALPSGSELA
jgi:Ca2+-transporting ATPase